MRAQSQLAVALDVKSRAEVFQWAQTFAGLPLVLKIGLTSLPFLKREDFLELKRQGFSLFVDAKLHDIPSQVAGAVKSWSELGADFLTLHTSGGTQMMREAQVVAKAQGSIRLLGVSMLTSLGQSDLAELGFAAPHVPEQVEKLVGLGLHAGLDSFVCSAQEVDLLREKFPSQSLFFCCPGISLDHQAAAADQKRVVTLSQALAKNISLLVMGRAILQSPQPAQTAREILARL